MPAIEFDAADIPIDDLNAETWWNLPADFDTDQPDYWRIDADVITVCRSGLKLKIGVGLSSREPDPDIVFVGFPGALSVDDAADFAHSLLDFCFRIQKILAHPRHWVPPVPGRFVS